MRPPSPTRKQQLLPWTQQLRASPTRSTEQLRRRRSTSSNSAMQSPEHTPTTTATYTAQFLRRRSSQHEIAAAHEEQHRRTTLRRHSSEEASVPTEQLSDSAGAAPQETDMTAEKGLTALEMKEKPAVPASPGKGTALRAAMDQDQNAAKRVAMPCGRFAVVLAVVAGFVTISAAGGIVLCRMFPTSPAAAAIWLAASRAEQELVELRDQARPYTMAFEEAALAKLLVLLKSASLSLKKPAHAAEELANELLDPSALAEVGKAATMCLAVAKDSRDLLQLVLLGLLDVLKASAEWIQARVEGAIDSVGMEAGREARSALLTALSSLSEVLEHGMHWSQSSLAQVFEWIGLESGGIDGNVPRGEFLAPLAIDQTAIQTVARKLMTEQSRALEDVKRFEKRRVTIASAANAVIADTQTIALESVVDARMVAADFIKERTKELAEQYAKALEQALEEFELTSRQVEKEGGSQVAAEISEDTQAHVDTGASLKRDLMRLAKAVRERLSATEERAAYSDEGQSQIGLPQEEPLLEAPKSPAQGDSDLVNEDQLQAAADLTEEDHPHVAVLGEVERTVVAEVVVDLEDVLVEVKHMEVEVVKIVDEHNDSDVDVELQQEDGVEVHVQVPGEGTGEELVEVDEVVAATEAIEAATEGQTDVARDEASQPQAEEGEPEQDVIAATSREIETLETEQVVVAQELEGLEQLEQALGEESELSRVEEELARLTEALRGEGKLVRVVELEQVDQALEEKSELVRVEDELERLERALEEQSNLVRGLQSESPPTDAGTSAQVGLMAAVLMALVVLAASFLARYYKRVRCARAPPRRRRWKRLADLEDSDTEEVVLLPESSDEEEDVAVAAPKERRSLVVTELVSSVEAEASVLMCSGGEEADVEEETSESHEEELDEKEEESEAVSMSTRSRTVVAKTTTADHPATSSSDASADDGGNSSVSATPPAASRQATPDTSERSRRRRREIRT